MNYAPPIPPFSQDLFVDREAELECVGNKIRQYLNRRPPRLRHTAFYGPRGCGKSWLLRYLAEAYLPQQFGDKIRIVFPPLDPANPSLFHDLLIHTATALGLTPLPMGAEPEEIAHWIPRRVQKMDRPAVFIVDEIDRLEFDALKEIEKNYIYPLEMEPHAFLVLGMRVLTPKGRLGDPTFKTHLETRHLPPFDATQTEVQADRLGASFNPDILEITGGNPLANAVLMKCGTVQDCAELMLAGVDASLRGYFWPLAVPDRIKMDQMPSLLAAYMGGTPEAWDRQTCHRILREMTATGLVRWEEGLTYRMDEALQRVLRRAFQEAEPDKWDAVAKIVESP